MKRKIIRIATVPQSLDLLLRGQLKMLSETYEVVAVSSPGQNLDEVARREGVRTVAVPMERHIAPLKDLVSLFRLIRLFRKEKPWMVHSITPKAGLLAMMAACICGVPVRIHMFTGLVFPTSKGLKRRILMTTDRLTCACATLVNPEGQGVKRDLERFHITSKPMRIIGNGRLLRSGSRKREVGKRRIRRNRRRRAVQERHEFLRFLLLREVAMQPSGRFIQPFLAVAQTANGQNKPDDLKCHQPQKKNENQQNSSHEFRFGNQIKPVHTKITFLCILQFRIPIAVDLLNLAGMRNGGIHDWLAWKIPECQAENAENGQHQLNCHQNRNHDFPAGFPARHNSWNRQRRFSPPAKPPRACRLSTLSVLHSPLLKHIMF